MSDSTGAAILELATKTHQHAIKLNRRSFFGFGRERRFENAIGTFSHALRHLGPAAITRMSDIDRRSLGHIIDAIVEDTERFIASTGGSLKRVERNRHLVTAIYDMRAAFESLSHGDDPLLMNLRAELGNESARRK